MQHHHPQPNRPVPPRPAYPPTRKAARRRKRAQPPYRLMALIAMVFSLSLCMALIIGGGILLSVGRVLPNVSALGVDLGMMTESQAADALTAAGTTLTLRDRSRIWNVAAADLGVTLDARATAQKAADVGLGVLINPVRVSPIVSMDFDQLTVTLTNLAPQINRPAQDAGVQFVNGRVEPVPPEYGRTLDVDATVARVAINTSANLANGEIELVMVQVAPVVIDPTPLIEQAQGLLSSPLRIHAYDPFSAQTHLWEASVTDWANWIMAGSVPGTAGEIQITLDPRDVETFLAARAQTLPPHQTIRVTEAVSTIRQAVEEMNTTPQIRIYEGDRTHTVRAGESITSIAWDYGIPYPYIQAANPSIETLNAGMTLTIPSREGFLEHPIVPNKRIVVSISGNWTKVYENGALKWEWVSSTGINSSPTWSGIYQIITHEENAYAGNWNLHMPWFMGVYKPIPGSDFTNGFHSFPTRGGGQLLWENSLGTRVTYGCILLSNTNAKLLYDWAQNGVIVEIQP